MFKSSFLYGQRSASIPLDYLISEIIAFPLTSVSAFKNRIVYLDPDMNGATGKLWRDAENQIVRSTPDFSIDHAVAIRDRLWFAQSSPSSSVFLNNYLANTAEEFFEIQGPIAIPFPFVRNREEDIPDRHRRNNSLRWMSFSLPLDLLLSGLETGAGPPAEIRYLSFQLFNHLKEYGFAEVHLHIWAALEFPVLWVTMLHGLADTEINQTSFESPGADFDEGRQLGPWLIRGAIARYLLALFLYETNTSYRPPPNFDKYLRQDILPKICRYQGAVAAEAVAIAITELTAGRFLDSSPTYPLLRGIYRDLARKTANPLPYDPGKVFFADPIAHLIPYRSTKEPVPEVQFSHRAITHLRKHAKPRDPFFETLFWQVIKLRGILYRHVVQRPLTPGLLWFIRTYSRIKPTRKTVGWEFAIRKAAKTCGKGEGLRSLEIRTSPEPSSSEMFTVVQSILSGMIKENAVKPDEKFEFGIVYHFTKTRGGNVYKGLPSVRWRNTEADPRMNEGKGVQCRYSLYYKEKKREALALSRLLFNFPELLKVIRGIDVCTDEVGVPSWVLAPHLRYVRAAGKAAATHLRYAQGEDVPELRMTLHSGEDFLHLAGGLRRVEESVRYLKLRPGDRLGHAIALGIQPESWAKRVGRIAMPREERLLDLSWEWMQYSENKVKCAEGRLAYIKREIDRLTTSLFPNQISPYQLETLVKNLHNEEMLRSIGFPDLSFTELNYRLNRKFSKNYGGNKIIRPTDNPMELMRHYLTNSELFERGQTIEWVNAIDEIEPLKNLQDYLRKIIANLGIAIEINPTSNLLIGNLSDLKNHPIWRLNPPIGTRGVTPIAVCIGSDDPVTFATNLRQEYALLHESLVSGGLTDSQAYAWLERAIETGLSYRFTAPCLSEIKMESEALSKGLPYLSSWHAFGLDSDVPSMP